MQKEPLKVLGETFFAVCKSVDTPVSLACWLQFKYGEHSDLVSRSALPCQYNSADSFSVDYLVVNYLRKHEGMLTGIDTEASATRKLDESEARCKTWNLLLKRAEPHPSHAVIVRARGLVSRILGQFHPGKVMSGCKWGPGSTSSLKRKDARIDKKIIEFPMSVTRLALPFIRGEIERDFAWASALIGMSVEAPFSLLPCCFRVVKGNRMVMVPKDAKTDRVICAEPTANSFLQQGVGRYIRARLKHFGVDLDDQSVNQTWASEAHRLGLATLDLSAASDSICYELVAALLPLEWYFYLSALRSEHTLYKGVWRENERFSSMGNAYTFELETLIFYAIVKTCTEDNGGGIVSTYGDDLIVPQHCASDAIKALEACGFVINTDKSFTSGRFFESCGKHYYDGVEVTPCYQKELIKSYRSRMRAHNRIIRWGQRSGLGVVVDSRIKSAVMHLRRTPGSEIPKHLIPLGTEGDDGFLISEQDLLTYDRYTASLTGKRQKRWRWRVLRTVTEDLAVDDSAVYAWSLRRGVVVNHYDTFKLVWDPWKPFEEIMVEEGVSYSRPSPDTGCYITVESKGDRAKAGWLNPEVIPREFASLWG